MNRNAVLTPTSFLSLQEISTRKMVIPRTWTGKEMVFYSWMQSTRRMGQSRRAYDDQIQWKRTPSLPILESIVPRSAKSKGGGKFSIHLCGDGDTIETVSRTIISVNQLSIDGAVSDLCEEYKSCYVRTGRPVLVGQSDPLFVPTSSLMKTPTPSTDDPAQDDLLQKSQERVDRLSQQNRVIKFCIDARIPDNGWCRTVLHDKRHWRILNLQSQWLVVSTHCQEMKNHLIRKVGFEGTPKLGPYWKSQPATYKVNMEWKLESSLRTMTILTRGSEFLMA